MKLKISKIITSFVIIGLLIKVASVFISQDNLISQDSYDGSFKIENTVTYIADFFFFTAGLLAFRYEGKYFKKNIKKMYIFLVFIIVLVYLKSGASLFDVGTFLSVKGIGPWLGLSVLFTAGNESRFRVVLKVILFLGIVLGIAAIINIGKLGIGFSRETAISSLRIISVNLMWISFISVIFFLKKYKKIVITLFIISVLLSLIIATRSFLLLHFLMLIYLGLKFIKKKIYLLISLLGIGLIAFFIYSYMPKNNFIENSIGLLDGRMTKDSRTEQYDEFFKNTDTTDFIFGAGVFSEWNQWGEMYGWLEVGS